MPDPTPEQQRAQERMREWMQRHQQTPTVPGPFGDIFKIGSTVQTLVAAAGAGQFAIAPDTGAAIIKQLTEVQKQTVEMQREVQFAAVDPQFGGGYAEQVSRFVQGVAAGQAGSAEEILTKFAYELDQLKEAVATSMGNYEVMDESSASGLTDAGGQS